MRRAALRLIPIGLAASAFACLRYSPPAPRAATRVGATMGATWDAVIDLFAARNIPIRSIERVSGIIVTDILSVGDDGPRWADCG